MPAVGRARGQNRRVKAAFGGARPVGLGLLCALCGLLTIACAPALAIRGHVFGGSFGAQGTEPGELNEPTGVAVNEATGDVYVYDAGNERVEYFSAAGTYLGRFDGSGAFFEVVGGKEVERKGTPAGAGGLPDEEPTGAFKITSYSASLAIDNDPTSPSFGDVYVDAGYSEKAIDKFAPNGEYVGQITAKTASFASPELFHPAGVSVGATGDVTLLASQEGVPELMADRFSDGLINEFLPPVTAIPEFHETPLTVGLNEDLYMGSLGDEYVLEVEPGTGRVLNRFDREHGVVARAGLATEFPSGDIYVDNIESVGRYKPEGEEVERFGEGQLSGGSGVAVDPLTGTVYVADTTDNDVQSYPLQPVSAPQVSGSSVTEVNSDSATLNATINPTSLPGETETSYHFVYGACPSYETCAEAGYEISTSVSALLPSFESEGVRSTVRGLAAGTVYHLKLLAENGQDKGAPVEGPEVIFTTRPIGSFGLLDGRAWEMVSPPNKEGALVQSINSGFDQEQGVIKAAADGDAISYITNTPTEANPAGYTNVVQVLSTRGSSGGWTSSDITVPHTERTGLSVGKGFETRFFSENLASAVIQPFGNFDPGLSEEASEDTAFLRSVLLNGDPSDPCVPARMHCYVPLVTGKPGYADVVEGAVFGGTENGVCELLYCGPEFGGATPDLGHVVLESQVPLTAGGAPGDYEWSADKPASERLQYLSTGFAGSRDAISADGTHVFGTEAMTDTATGKTLTLPGRFLDASADGSRVFTMQPSFSGRSGDLSVCEIEEVDGEPKCDTTDLTPSGETIGEVGASEDGSWVYFVSDQVLESGGTAVAGAITGNCTGTSAYSEKIRQRCDLYADHYVAASKEWTLRLVAVISGVDSPDYEAGPPARAARVSPNGEWIAFMSLRAPTGYDNADALTGRPDVEVYLYNGVTGRLACASCNPTGARPHGVQAEHVGGANEPLVDDTSWGEASVAANVPGWTAFRLDDAIYQPRYLSDEGRLFFNSDDSLVAKDVNGVGDVYEYEPEGVGSCDSSATSGSVTFKPERRFDVEGQERQEGAGCVGLVSSGESAEESAFLDASQSGGDVFFITTAKLAPQDMDEALDVYDAHECATSAPCPASAPVPAPECTTEVSCRPAPSPQPAIFGAPSSATFAGPGNIGTTTTISGTPAKALRCRKGFAKRRGKCVKRRKKRARPSQSKKGGRR